MPLIGFSTIRFISVASAIDSGIAKAYDNAGYEGIVPSRTRSIVP
jgi:hypothetical protein